MRDIFDSQGAYLDRGPHNDISDDARGTLSAEAEAEYQRQQQIGERFRVAFEPFVYLAKLDDQAIQWARRIGNTLERAGYHDLAQVFYAEQVKYANQAADRRDRIMAQVMREIESEMK